MERSTKKGPRALRVVAGNDRRAIERSVKEMFANAGELVLPILSLVTEARAQLEDVLGEVNRDILESLLLASAEERAGSSPRHVWNFSPKSSTTTRQSLVWVFGSPQQ